uniref:Uncharacterized protein n=1 Tax=Romanomermis culicivorax TaxID=13658 RepID=A0A915IWP1_ROMCU
MENPKTSVPLAASKINKTSTEHDHQIVANNNRHQLDHGKPAKVANHLDMLLCQMNAKFTIQDVSTAAKLVAHQSFANSIAMTSHHHESLVPDQTGQCDKSLYETLHQQCQPRTRTQFQIVHPKSKDCYADHIVDYGAVASLLPFSLYTIWIHAKLKTSNAKLYDSNNSDIEGLHGQFAAMLEYNAQHAKVRLLVLDTILTTTWGIGTIGASHLVIDGSA